MSNKSLNRTLENIKFNYVKMLWFQTLWRLLWSELNTHSVLSGCILCVRRVELTRPAVKMISWINYLLASGVLVGVGFRFFVFNFRMFFWIHFRFKKLKQRRIHFLYFLKKYPYLSYPYFKVLTIRRKTVCNAYLKD